MRAQTPAALLPTAARGRGREANLQIRKIVTVRFEEAIHRKSHGTLIVRSRDAWFADIENKKEKKLQGKELHSMLEKRSSHSRLLTQNYGMHYNFILHSHSPSSPFMG